MSGSRWTRVVACALLLVVVALSAAFAYELLFTTFRNWDDEGYFLLALRAWRQGHSLYGEIETYYGPFYFQAVGGIASLLHVPLDNVGARWLVLAFWILSCLGVLHYVRRITGSWLAGFVAYAIAFPLLDSLANEPLHPGGPIVLLLSLLVVSTAILRDPTRRTGGLVACGAITAACALSKLNVGAFVLLAFGVYFLHSAQRTRATLALRVALAVLLPLVPIVLMDPLMGQKQFRAFAFLVTVSLVPFGFLPGPEASERSSRRAIPYVFGGAALTVVVLAVCLSTGTRAIELWRSLVLDTLRFPGAFTDPPRFRSAKEVWMVAAAIPIFLCQRCWWMAWLGAGARTLFKLACGLVILHLCLSNPWNSMRALPLVWVVAAPGPEPRRDSGIRTLLALLVVLQALHAYPVAGSQVGFFTFLIPAVGMIIVWDSLAEWPLKWRASVGRTAWKVAGVVASIALLVLLALEHPLRATVPAVRARFRLGVPLALTGAESIRLPERRAAELCWVTANLEHNGETLMGLPDMQSFHVWSSLAPPVPFYSHTWIFFHDPDKEAELARALLASRRPCLVRNRSLMRLWSGPRGAVDGPLLLAVESEFHVAGAVGDYEVLVPNSARPDLVLSVFSEVPPRALRARFALERVLRVSLPVMNGVHVARIVVHDTRQDVDVFDSAADAPDERVGIVNAAGTELLRTGTAAVIDMTRQMEFYMLCPKADFEIDPDSTLVRCHDEGGRIVARVLAPRVSGGR